jgi:hypothetical protein
MGWGVRSVMPGPRHPRHRAAGTPLRGHPRASCYLALRRLQAGEGRGQDVDGRDKPGAQWLNLIGTRIGPRTCYCLLPFEK